MDDEPKKSYFASNADRELAAATAWERLQVDHPHRNQADVHREWFSNDRWHVELTVYRYH